MGKGIFWSTPAHGDTNPLLATLSELKKRGENVIYYGEEEFRKKVELTGIEFRLYKGHIHKIDWSLAENNMFTMLRSMLRYGYDKLEHNLADIKKESPDYILHGSMSIWGKTLGKLLNIKTINLIHSAPVEKNDIKITPSLFSSFIFPMLWAIFEGKINPSSIQATYQKKFRQKINWIDLTTNKEDLNLVYCPAFLAPELVKTDGSYKFIGPSLFFKDGRESDGFLFNYISKIKNSGQKLIFISLGTVHANNPEFYKKCLRAFHDKNISIIMSIGHETAIESIGKIPENFLVRNYIPQQEILKHVDLFITHGGMNSVNEALYYGVPMLVLPHQIEQETNGRRIKKIGTGIYYPIKKATEKLLYFATTELLENQKYTNLAKDYSALVKRDEVFSSKLAVDEIINYLSTH